MEVGARMGIPGQRRVPRSARTARRTTGIALAILLALAPVSRTPGRRRRPTTPSWDRGWTPSLVGRPAGSTAPAPGSDRPRLLALAPPDPHEPGTIHLVLLDRGPDRWSVAGRLDVPTGLAVAGAGELVPIDDAVALVSTDVEARRTSVTRIVLGTDGLRQGAQAVLDLGSGAVGAIDVDGDGVPELALTGDAPQPFVPLADCRRTLFEVLDARHAPGADRTHRTRRDARVGGDREVRRRRPVDRRPGHAGLRPRPRRVVGPSGSSGSIRRRAGPDWSATSALDQRPVPSGAAGPNRPLSIDLDGDGRDEVIIRTGDGTSILEPDRGWRMTTLDDGAIPLAVAAAASGPPVLALYRAGAEGTGGGTPTLELRVVRRDAGGVALGVRAVTVAVGGGSDGLAPPLAISLATDPGGPAAGLVGGPRRDRLHGGHRAGGDVPGLWAGQRLDRASRPGLAVDPPAGDLRTAPGPAPAGRCRAGLGRVRRRARVTVAGRRPRSSGPPAGGPPRRRRSSSRSSMRATWPTSRASRRRRSTSTRTGAAARRPSSCSGGPPVTGSSPG